MAGDSTAAATSEQSLGGRAMALGAALFIAGLAGWLLSDPTPRAKTPEELALAAKPKTVLLIVIDTLRADHLGCYGGKAAATPTLDALAARGVRFDNAVCPTPLTRPSISSMMTGRYPREHGVRDNVGVPLPADVPTLAQQLKQAGYTTGGFVSGEPVNRSSGLDRGFDHYDDRLGKGSSAGYGYGYGYGHGAGYGSYGYGANVHLRERRADRTLDKAAAWLKQQGSAHAFAWVHLFDPHAPYDPPEPEKTKYEGSPYAGEVAYVDRMLGEFFAQLKLQGRWDDTLVVVTSDHGEGLGEHGEDTHGHFLYDTTMRVPLIVAGPGVASGGRAPGQFVHCDLAPTLCELLDAGALRGATGASAAGALRASATKSGADRYVYLESLYSTLRYGWSPIEAVRSPAAKFVVAGGEAVLYALGSDPHETSPVPMAPGDGRPLLRDVLHATRPAVRGSRRAVPSSGGSVASPYGSKLYGAEGTQNARNPLKASHLIRVIDRARRDAGRGKHTEALAGFRSVLQEDGGNLYAKIWEAHALRRLGRYDQALMAYEAVADKLVAPEQETWRGMAATLLDLKRFDEAEERCARLLREWPRDIEAWKIRAVAAADNHKLAAALSHFESALSLAPNDPTLTASVGAVLVQRGEIAVGTEKLLKSLRLSPRDKRVTGLVRAMQVLVSKEDAALGKTLADALFAAETSGNPR